MSETISWPSTTDFEEPLRLGIELEVPFTPHDAPKWQSVGVTGEKRDTSDFSHELDRYTGSLDYEWVGGQMFDKLYGYEVRTAPGGIPPYALNEWYRDVYQALENYFGREIEPTGFLEDSSAGIHVHFSPVSKAQMRDLYELSRDPVVQVFAMSSIATWEPNGTKDVKGSVRRSEHTDFCRLDEFDKHGHSCITYKGPKHYSWRLPEPMTPDHFDLLSKFIALFMRDTSEAYDFAESLVMNGDERITAIRRARECRDDLSPECKDSTEATDLLVEVL